MDFDFVTRRLATGGGLTDPADVDALVKAGITHIIDCRDDFDDAALLIDRGLTYLRNGTADDGTPKPVEWFQRSIEFALTALGQPKHKVYAHCACGVNRGPSTAFAILRALGLPHEVAKSMIWAARPATIAGIRYRGDADKAITALGYE